MHTVAIIVHLALFPFVYYPHYFINVADIFSPTISAPQVFFGMVGSESNYTVSIISDVGNINFAFNGTVGIDSFPSNVRLSQVNSTTVSLLWTPLHHNEFFVLDVISFLVIENRPTAYSLLRPQVQLCNCQNGGTCTTDGVLQYDANFILLQCVCLTGM